MTIKAPKKFIKVALLLGKIYAMARTALIVWGNHNLSKELDHDAGHSPVCNQEIAAIWA